MPTPATPETVTSSQRSSVQTRAHASSSIPSSRSRPTNGESKRRAGASAETESSRHAGTGSRLPFSSSGSIGSAVAASPARRIVPSPTRISPALRSLLEPRRRRDGAAGHEPLVRADDNLAALDADPAFDPELGDRVPHLHRRPQRAQCIVLVHRRHPEHGHHRVPDELLDHAPMAFRSGLHLLEVRRQQSAQRLRIERLSELGGVGDVREKHGHDLPLRPSDHLGLRRARRLGAPCPDRVRRRLGRRRGWGRVERRILHKDRLLEPLQSLARVEAELVAQRRARFLHHGERVRLATGPVQGEHQQLAQPLAQRVVADERLQLGDRLAVSTDREVGLQAMLERDEAQRFQPADLVARERLVAEVRQRRAAPQRERAAQHLARLGRGPSGKQLPALVQQPLEPLQIERAVLDPHQVAERPRLDHPIAERLPQLRHVHLQRLDRSRGRLLIPQRINEPLRRHRLARVQQQDRKQRALLRRPQLELGPVLPDRQRTENPEFHPTNVTPATNKLKAHRARPFASRTDPSSSPTTSAASLRGHHPAEQVLEPLQIERAEISSARRYPVGCVSTTDGPSSVRR